MQKVVIYTDGACDPNPGKGGWAALLTYKRCEKMIAGNHPRATNNRMELLAVVEGVRALKKSCRVHIVTDSQYVAKCGNGVNRKKAHLDLWKKLHTCLREKGHQIKFHWVRGHNGHPQNERCDQEANRQTRLI